MRGREDEAAIQADAYIDSLLARGRVPVPAVEPALLPADEIQRAIRVLQGALPRYHPSFVFEESLAARLQRAAAGRDGVIGDLIHLPLPEATSLAMAGIDRRLLVGGAIASGVSLAGAAMLVRAHQRRGRSRLRREWLS